MSSPQNSYTAVRGTYHFSRRQARAAPSRRIGRAAVVAFATDAIAQFCSGVVCVNNIAGLTRVRLRWDKSGPDRACRYLTRNMGRGGGVRGTGMMTLRGHSLVSVSSAHVRVRVVRVWCRRRVHGRALTGVLIVGSRRLRNLWLRLEGRRRQAVVEHTGGEGEIEELAREDVDMAGE